MATEFWNLFTQRTAALEVAIRGDDAESLVGITNELAENLIAFNPQLNLMIGGRDPFRLSILSLPGAEECANQFVSGAPHISNWQISAGIPEYDPLKSVHVTDDEGRSLTISYADLDVKVLPIINGHSTIVLSLDSDFDPTGPKSHLYQAIAENVIFAVLGGWPLELSKVVMLPRTKTGKLQPLESLRNQWLALVRPHRVD